MKSNTALRMKQAMELNSINQAELVKRTGISKGALSSYLSGRYIPKQNNTYLIAKALNVSAAWLMGADVPMEKELSKDTPSIEPFSPGRYRIPIVGRIAAGLPIYNGGEIEGYIDYDKDPGKHVFALRIHGHSMEPRIMSGDLVIIDEEAGWEDGDIVAVTVNGDDGTCKRIKRYSDSIALIPINPDFDPQVYSSKQIQDLPVTVVGKVIELRARF